MDDLKNMFVFRVAIIFCLAILFSPLATAQESLPNIVKRISPSVVVIMAYDKNGDIVGQGSGFFINKKGGLITNRHVLEGANHVKVKTSDGKLYPVNEVLAEDTGGDITLLSAEIPRKEVHAISISDTTPEVGEQVVVIGNPLGLEQTVSDGIVSAVRQIPGFGKIIQITAPISPGSSGSPVVNMKGEVIGIATLQIVEGQNLNFAIPGERVAKFTLKHTDLFSDKELETAAELAEAVGGFRMATLLGDAKIRFPNKIDLFFSDDGRVFIAIQLPECEHVPPLPSPFSKVAPAIIIGPRSYYLIRGFVDNERTYVASSDTGFHQEIKVFRINYLEKLSEYDKPTPDNKLVKRGKSLMESDSYEEAIDAFSKAIEINPRNAAAYYNRGITWSKKGDYDLSIDDYNKALEINPRHGRAYNNRGRVWYIKGDYDRACSDLRVACELRRDCCKVLDFVKKEGYCK
jgi:hypothetical protein